MEVQVTGGWGGHCEGINTSIGTARASIMMYRLISLYWVGGGEGRQEQMKSVLGRGRKLIRASNGVLKY